MSNRLIWKWTFRVCRVFFLKGFFKIVLQTIFAPFRDLFRRMSCLVHLFWLVQWANYAKIRNLDFVCLFESPEWLFPTYHKCDIIFLVLFVIFDFSDIPFTFVNGGYKRIYFIQVACWEATRAVPSEVLNRPSRI